MTTPEIERAARGMKMFRLAQNQMLDHVAIQLNSQPTQEEAAAAKLWARAFDLAQQGLAPDEIATQLAS